MAKDSGMGMHAGMTNKCPSGVDKSMDRKGGRVDDDATRKGVAPTPRSLGPRNA